MKKHGHISRTKLIYNKDYSTLKVYLSTRDGKIPKTFLKNQKCIDFYFKRCTMCVERNTRREGDNDEHSEDKKTDG